MRLRIGIDAHVITGKYQGTRTTLTSLLRALARQEIAHEIIVYTDDPDAANAAIGSSNFTYVALGHSGSIKRLLRVFPRLLRRDTIDVAVFQYNAPLVGRTKRVVFIHDILPMTHPQFFPFVNRMRVWLFYSLSVLRATMVVAVSDYTRRMVEIYYKLPSGRVRTVLNGPSFSEDTYAGVYEPVEPRYILTVGRIEERKNIELLVNAFCKANVPELRLIVVGAPDLGFAYRFPINDPRIENRIGIEETELINLYRGASLFIYPSAAEGFGIPLLDALLFGIPTISSDQTAMREIATDVAELFDPNEPDAAEALTAKIVRHFGICPIIAPTKEQRSVLSERFSWDRAAIDFITVVEAAAGSHTL